MLKNYMVNFPDWWNKGTEYLEYIREGIDFIPNNKIIRQYEINKDNFIEYEEVKSIIKKLV